MIDVGDLVMVVNRGDHHADCSGNQYLGTVGHVKVVVQFVPVKPGASIWCSQCGAIVALDEPMALANLDNPNIDMTFQVKQLRKIPPLAELESKDQREEIPA